MAILLIIATQLHEVFMRLRAFPFSLPTSLNSHITQLNIFWLLKKIAREQVCGIASPLSNCRSRLITKSERLVTLPRNKWEFFLMFHEGIKFFCSNEQRSDKEQTEKIVNHDNIYDWAYALIYAKNEFCHTNKFYFNTLSNYKVINCLSLRFQSFEIKKTSQLRSWGSVNDKYVENYVII